MKVVFFSNYLNHHQLPLCLAMQKLTHGDFYFVASQKTPAERLKMGYEDMNKKHSFVIQNYDSKSQDALALAKVADLMIVGGDFPEYTKARRNAHKIWFRYSERLFKQKPSLRTWFSFLRYYGPRQTSGSYLLCAGAHTASDFNKCLAYIHKTYKWGYFPETDASKGEQELLKTKKPKTLLWAGRLIDWKHPEQAIRSFASIGSSEYQMKIVGDGPMMSELKKLAKTLGVNKNLTFTGFLPHAKVREEMQKASVFLFTSDRNEGWGAVLNEAMSEGCIVIANDGIGSAPYLIQNKVNGFSYHSQTDLNQTLRDVLSHEADLSSVRLAAIKTIKHTWNAEVAAQRLINLAQDLKKHHQSSLYKNGPCSQA